MPSSPTTPTSTQRSPNKRDTGGKHAKTMKTPSSHTKRNKQFFTPNTPNHHFGKSSQLTTSPDLAMNDAAKAQLETPMVTPRRHSRSGSVGSTRKRGLDAGIEFDRGRAALGSEVLFPPTPSTVGAGRKSVTSEQSLIQSSPTLELGNSLKVDLAQNESLMPSLNVKKRRGAKNTYESDEEEEEGETPGEGLRKVSKRLEFGDAIAEEPSTPHGQLMDETYAYNKYIEEKNDLSDGEGETEEQHNERENPFIGEFKKPLAPMPAEYKRFETEVELVNHRTGKRIVRALDAEEAAIKPKRLFFEEVKEPTTPGNKVGVDRQVISPRRRGPSVEDPHETIRSERIVNPFRGHSGSSKSRRKHHPKRVDEIEYINHTTGEKVVREMTAEERTIKPRRLRFD